MSGMKDTLGETYFESQQAFARNTDLQTSHAAAKKVNSKVPYLEMAVLVAIAKVGLHGATWNEIEQLAGIDKASVSPRFKPLRKKNFIVAKTVFVGIEEETVKRDGQTVWIATPTGIREAMNG